MATDTASTSTESPKRGMGTSRQLSGTSFLTLEHVGYFTLVTFLPSVLIIAVLTAIDLWSNNSGGAVQPLGLTTLQPIITNGDNAIVAIQAAAALIVLAPLLLVLRRRTAAEYDKRTGYKNRVGYKLPVYTALALLTTATVASFASMLSVFLRSLTQIGVSGADIGKIYTAEFIPALIMFAVFSVAALYTFWFAKGRDKSKIYIGFMALISGVFAIALFVTVLNLNHDPNRGINSGGPIQIQPYPNSSNNLFNY
jgi:hypothetical protein